MSRSALVDDLKFQSTPAITGGRCLGHAEFARLDQCFNPRPPLLAGDAMQDIQDASDAIVSIHARHYWRAMRPQSCSGCAKGCCFNPRPPLLAGDAIQPGSKRVDPWFQSTPAITGGRCNPSAQVMRFASGFQSTPAITGGRCDCLRGIPQADHGFNPRPPLLAGDAGRHRSISSRSAGFNPRPPLLAGDASTVT